MKIGFITTINTNIGDDFIRCGIENIISSIKDRPEIKYTRVNKHKPETAILYNRPLDLLNKLPHFKGKHFFYKAYDRFLSHMYSVYSKQDLIIQGGGPVLWPGCHKNEWAKPIWYNTIGKIKNKIPVLDLAAGSCYPWEDQDGFTDKHEATYAKDIGGFCRLTTTRDKLAQQLFESVGVKNELMPCTAFFVNPDFDNTNESEYVLINYMEGGGHFDWNQQIDKTEWETTIISVVNEIKKYHEVRFICHSKEEVKLAEKIAPGHTTYFPKSIDEYLSIISKAKLGINNRMHASVAMASVGVPAISICTDTRLLMLDTLGMPIWYVKEVNKQKLITQAMSLLENTMYERERLFELKKKSFTNYQQIIAPFLTKSKE